MQLKARILNRRVDQHVGARLRLRRVELGVVQSQLGEALGVGFQQIHKYERGLNRMSVAVLFQVAEVLGVDIRYFFDGLTSSSMSATGGDEPDPIQRFFHLAEGPELATLCLDMPPKARHGLLLAARARAMR